MASQSYPHTKVSPFPAQSGSRVVSNGDGNLKVSSNSSGDSKKVPDRVPGTSKVGK